MGDRTEKAYTRSLGNLGNNAVGWKRAVLGVITWFHIPVLPIISQEIPGKSLNLREYLCASL